MTMEDPVIREPAGLRRRGLAALIDWAICALLLGGFAPVLFAMTDGRWQYEADFVPRWCWDRPIPPDFAFPPDFTPNFAKECVSTLAGWPTARTITVGRRTVEGNTTTTVVYNSQIDAAGWLIPRAPIESPSIELMILMRLLLDSFARSPGRRICRIAVVERAGGRRARFALLWKRYLLFALPVGLGYLAFLVVPPALPFWNWPWHLLGLAVAPVLISGALSLWAVVSVARRRPAYYDRPTDTAVMRR